MKNIYYQITAPVLNLQDKCQTISSEKHSGPTVERPNCSCNWEWCCGVVITSAMLVFHPLHVSTAGSHCTYEGTGTGKGQSANKLVSSMESLCTLISRLIFNFSWDEWCLALILCDSALIAFANFLSSGIECQMWVLLYVLFSYICREDWFAFLSLTFTLLLRSPVSFWTTRICPRSREYKVPLFLLSDNLSLGVTDFLISYQMQRSPIQQMFIDKLWEQNNEWVTHSH